MHTPARKNRKFLVLTLLLNAAAIGSYAFLFTEIKQKNEHISTLVNGIDAETKESNVLNSVKTLVVETLPLRKKLDSYAVKKEGSVDFIELLENVGRDADVDVDIDSVEPVELPESPRMELLRLVLTAKGSWSSLMRFLGLVELLPYETRLDHVIISKAPEGTVWRVDFSLAVLKEK